jgi:hypothetical protein
MGNCQGYNNTNREIGPASTIGETAAPPELTDGVRLSHPPLRTNLAYSGALSCEGYINVRIVVIFRSNCYFY